MKVALCLSGHFRTFMNCRDGLFTHLINLYNPDVFIHTWTKLGFSRNYSSGHSFDEEEAKTVEKNKKYGNSQVEFYRNTPDIGNIYECLNPKKIIIEKYEDIEEQIYSISDTITKRNTYDYVPTLVSQTRKIYLCNRLKDDYEKENNFVYDVVIRSRPDVAFSGDIKLENMDIIHTPTSEAYNIISDIFAFSSSENMNKYCSLFEKIKEYTDLGEVVFNPHELLKYHLSKMNTTFSIEDLPLHLERNKQNLDL